MLKITRHHHDARGPAINVKCYHIDRDVPANARGTDKQQHVAWEYANGRWWGEAQWIADEHALGRVCSAGRMGGWLYTAPLPPEDEYGNRAYPDAFLADLEALLDAAPEYYAEALASVVRDDKALAARALQDRIDAARERIRELCALRNMPGFPNARNELRESIQELRDLRDERKPDHSEFI